MIALDVVKNVAYFSFKKGQIAVGQGIRMSYLTVFSLL